MSSKGKVLVAMSGGVDSSVAAALLVRAGYDAVGVFMRLGSPGESLDSPIPIDDRGLACDPAAIKIGHQGCCSIADAGDARLVAAELGIPLYVCNFKRDFNRVIDYFVDEYAAGRTPNPCVRCNDWLKFGKLHDYARQIGAGAVASGHYARVEARPSADGPTPALLRGRDHGKDQSYVLFGVPRTQLAHTLFPIGGFPKAEVRGLARAFGLPTFDKPDSQEICFVPDNDYAGLIERRRPDLARAGAIIDPDGRALGHHPGQHRFTVGQRRGLGLPAAYPLYVLRKDPAANTVTVGPREHLLTCTLTAAQANWLIHPSPVDPLPVLAKYRYNTPAAPATLHPAVPASPGAFSVRFESPQEAVAPGQAVVLYDAADPDRVLGGGWIESVQPAPQNHPTP